MAAILADRWAEVADCEVNVVAVDPQHAWLAELMSRAVREEIELVNRRRATDPELPRLAGYDKSYERKYTEYIRDNPMYDMSDYTAGMR